MNRTSWAGQFFLQLHLGSGTPQAEQTVLTSSSFSCTEAAGLEQNEQNKLCWPVLVSAAQRQGVWNRTNRESSNGQLFLQLLWVKPRPDAGLGRTHCEQNTLCWSVLPSVALGLWPASMKHRTEQSALVVSSFSYTESATFQSTRSILPPLEQADDVSNATRAHQWRQSAISRKTCHAAKTSAYDNKRVPVQHHKGQARFSHRQLTLSLPCLPRRHCENDQ